MRGGKACETINKAPFLQLQRFNASCAPFPHELVTLFLSWIQNAENAPMGRKGEGEGGAERKRGGVGGASNKKWGWLPQTRWRDRHCCTAPLRSHRRQALPAQGIAWRNGSERRGSYSKCAGTREHTTKRHVSECDASRIQLHPRDQRTTAQQKDRPQERKGPNRPHHHQEGMEWNGKGRYVTYLQGVVRNGEVHGGVVARGIPTNTTTTTTIDKKRFVKRVHSLDDSANGVIGIHAEAWWWWWWCHGVVI
jgi:hypothetical protein